MVTQQNTVKLMTVSFAAGIVAGWWLNRIARRKLKTWYHGAQARL